MGRLHVLAFVRGPRSGERVPVDPERGLVVGRSSDTDLRLAEDAVSRKHARFFERRGYTWVVDVGSHSGVWVNGRRIRRHRLLDGDLISIGAHLMRVHVGAPTAAAADGPRAAKARTEESGSGRSMRGTLEDIPLMDVLQWLATSRKTGTLNVRGADGKHLGRLTLRGGQVFDAVIEGREGLDPEKALLRMLRWRRGFFELDAAVEEDAERRIATSLEHMLMEAARQEDELGVLAAKHSLPGEADEVEVLPDGPTRFRDLEGPELDLLQAVLQHRRWGAVLDETEMSDLDATRSLVKLRKAGLVRWS